MFYKQTSTSSYYWLDEGEPYQQYDTNADLMANIKIRKLLPTDIDQGIKSYFFTNGGNTSFHVYVPSVAAKFKYPDTPTFESILSAAKGMPKTIPLTQSVTLMNDGGMDFLINYGGNHILKFYDKFLIFYNPTALKTMGEVELQKYLGKTLKYEKYHVKFPDQDIWYRIGNHLTFNLADKTVDKSLNGGRYWEDITTFDRASTTINEYLAWLNAEYILKSFTWFQDKKITMQSRCYGCQANDAAHIIIHMKRKELPFAMFSAAVQMYWDGNAPTDEGRVLAELQKSPDKTLPLIKNVLRSFLEFGLYPSSIMRHEIPCIRGTTWTLRNTTFWKSSPTLVEGGAIHGGSPFNSIFTNEPQAGGAGALSFNTPPPTTQIVGGPTQAELEPLVAAMGENFPTIAELDMYDEDVDNGEDV